MSEPLEREVAVFSAARRLPAAERAAYLDEACAGDEALRQRVEELLRASEEAGGFLQYPAPGAQRPADALASPGTLQIGAGPGEKIGDRIGRYKLLQQIGEGGCELVKLRYFVGMTLDEAAEVLGRSARTADNYWAHGWAWLFRELKGQKN